MSGETVLKTSDTLDNVRYEIRGKLAAAAHELARKGFEIISLNIGNPALFGFAYARDDAARDHRKPSRRATKATCTKRASFRRAKRW
jgi:aspartate/methionine/tyrosine aminotransferase